jgi:hypothetical protein
MQFHQITLALGIISIYIGFSVALGLMLHDHSSVSSASHYLPILGFILLVFIPATAMVLSYTVWSSFARLFVTCAGWLAGFLSAAQPDWIPTLVWQRHFQRGYLALAMGLSSWAIFSSGAAMLIGLAALTAGSSSARALLTT